MNLVPVSYGGYRFTGTYRYVRNFGSLLTITDGKPSPVVVFWVLQ
jgi:hypothetical protein